MDEVAARAILSSSDRTTGAVRLALFVIHRSLGPEMRYEKSAEDDEEVELVTDLSAEPLTPSCELCQLPADDEDQAVVVLRRERSPRRRKSSD